MTKGDGLISWKSGWKFNSKNIDAHDEDLVQAEYAESNGGQGFCDQVRFKKLSRAWWHKPLISALGRQRQTDF